MLVTTNGQPANLLSGGEFPILVPQSLGTVTIQWKEFGVRLTAVPILLGNGRVRLNLQPEVSQKDFSNAVSTGGLTVPGLTTRRVNTSVEMRFGETFMLGGLIEIQDTAQTFKTPFLGELPYIGAAFRRVSYQTTETELVILVTPVLAGAMSDSQMPPGGPGMFTDQPTDRELYWYGLLETPSYGGVCGSGCGNNNGTGKGTYGPTTVDFDMGPHQAPLFSPVPVQELPTIHEQFGPPTSNTPPAPALPGHPAVQMGTPPSMTQDPMNAPSAPFPATPISVGPPSQTPASMGPLPAPGASTMTLPPQAPAAPAGSATWWRNSNVRQVNAQSSSAAPTGATQALYSTPAPAAPAASPSGIPGVPAAARRRPASATGCSNLKAVCMCRREATARNYGAGPDRHDPHVGHPPRVQV